MKIQRIVVPVDFSYHANNALHLGMALANRWGAALTVLHVDPLPGIGTVAIEPVYIAPQTFQGLHAEHDARVEANLAEIVAELAPRAGEGVSVSGERRRGDDPVQGIIAFAEERKAELIVMGSIGVSGVVHLLLGSTANKVARMAPCPVLIAGRADYHRSAAREFRRVLAGIDYSRFSGYVAHLAARMRAPGGMLELMHVWNAPHLSALYSSLGAARDEVVSLAENARREQADMMASFGADQGLAPDHLTHYVATGNAAGALLERAAATEADLIVLGAHGRESVTERLIGTVADRVLRHAECPVLLIPESAL